MLKQLKKYLEQDRGVGDTVERVVHAAGLDRLAPTNCNCQRRKERLNELFPYKTK